MEITKEELKKIFEQFLPDEDNDDDYMLLLKNSINKLDTADKTILLLYADIQSHRKVGELFNVSHSTMMKEMKKIRERLFNIMEKERRKGYDIN